MTIPKVKFVDIALSLELDMLYGFLFQNDWDWGKYIIKKHPQIKPALVLKTKTARMNFLKEYVLGFRKENKELIKNNKVKYRQEWQKIEKDFLTTLAEILEIDWPENKRTITAMVSLNPICPRFLNNWSFSLSYSKNLADLREVIMHEICHFLYFEKWKKLYPKMSTKKFEAPHIEWHLSEIVAPIILNDERIQPLLKQKAGFYDEHRKIKIGWQSVPKYFAALYLNNKKEGKNFADFVKHAYKVMKDNKSLFKF